MLLEAFKISLEDLEIEVEFHQKDFGHNFQDLQYHFKDFQCNKTLREGL